MLGFLGTARSQVLVDAVVTFDSSASLFLYQYSVTNNGSADLAIITFGVAPGSDTVLSPSAPTGFLISFDPGVSLVSFTEDNDSGTPQTFAPGTTVSGFSFSSALGPGSVQFEAQDANGDSFFGVTSAPIPEAGTSALLVFGAALLGGWFLRRRDGLVQQAGARNSQDSRENFGHST